MLYAMRSGRSPLPKHRAAGCPDTGWLHEGHPPYRVIVASDPAEFRGTSFEVVEYDGDEDTVDFAEWIGSQTGSIASTVYVARWSSTWGEYHGTAGVFSTEQAARDALRKVEPRSEHHVFPVVVDEVREDWECRDVGREYQVGRRG